MKTLFSRTILILVFCFAWYGEIQAQVDYYSYRSSDTIHYTLDRNYIAVQLDTAWVTDSLAQIWTQPEWDSLPIEVSQALNGKNYVSFSINYPADSSLDTNSFILHLMDSIKLRQNVVAVYPFLMSDSGETFILTRSFFVKLRSDTTGNYDSTDILAYSDLRDSTKTTIIEEHFGGTTFDLLTISDSSTETSLEIANRFYESGYFVASEPDFIIQMKPFYTPDDTRYGEQWGLSNTGQSGGTTNADADVDLAWEITTGCPEIRTAIIDVGVDRDHQDIAPNLMNGFDLLTGTLKSINGDIYRDELNSPEPGYFDGATWFVTDKHGTILAGVIGAKGDNTLGIAGVAYTSKMVPIRYASQLKEMQIGREQTIATHSAFASAFSIAANNADIICFAWGDGHDNQLHTDAINNAVSKGRNGLGSIVVVGSGNNNVGTISYPGLLSNVITVGATDRTDHRSEYSSSEGSNYGSELDVCAPGEDILTTDVLGTRGYDPTEYKTITETSTSLATAFVSGVMALILSAQPTLTATEARYILESTCDKVHPSVYNYLPNVPGHPNGSWSNELGYGRVNARAAVEKAATLYFDHVIWANYYGDYFGDCANRDYFAKKKIIAGENVNTSASSHGKVEVYSTTGTKVEFRAGEEIALLPGFEAYGTYLSDATNYGGATFSAYISTVCEGYNGVSGINPSGGSSAKAGLSPAEYIPPTTQESTLSLSPNPVSGLLRIRFAVPTTCPVHIDIVNLFGQRIARVVDGEQSQGNHNFKFDVSDLTNGMYFVQLRTPTGMVTKPIIVTH